MSRNVHRSVLPTSAAHLLITDLIQYRNPKPTARAPPDHLDAIDEDEVPEGRRNVFVEIQKSMHRVAPLNGEGSVCASVRKMSPVEAGDCAIKILAIYREMLRDSEDDSPDLQIDHENRKAVPAFLLKSV